MDEDLKPQKCPSCGSTITRYDGVFDFWKCERCSTVWSDGRNDPDYDDDMPQACEAIAEMNMERIKGHPN